MVKSQNILYCSTLCSTDLINFLFRTSIIKPLLSGQKFHNLFVEGLIGNDCNVTALSSIPVSRKKNKKLLWIFKSETFHKRKHIYPFFINIDYLRQIFIFLNSFLYTCFWCITNKKEESIIICNILNVAVSSSSFLAGKLFNYRVCAIVTDLPYFEFNSDKPSPNYIDKYAKSVSLKIISYYDYYVLLTEQMNNIVNIKKRPYVIIEGMVDVKMKEKPKFQKNANKIILYSGGIFEKYGIKKLINAFGKLEDKSLQLFIYGLGEMENEMATYMQRDKRIKYFGMVQNETVVKSQYEATFLVNPRSTSEEYTKYSFPSKNMEYMVSGTPTLTTALPGMPIEYFKYVFLIEDESEEGIEEKLREILSKPVSELNSFGEKARQFVLREKNNVEQTSRFLQILI